MGIRPRGSWWLRRTTRSAIRQELQPKMDKPLGRNSKPYHIHTHTSPQFCPYYANVLIMLKGENVYCNLAEIFCINTTNLPLSIKIHLISF